MTNINDASAATNEPATNRRVIKSRAATRELRDLLQNLLIAEMLRPRTGAHGDNAGVANTPLWIVTPMLGNVVIVDNSAAGFASLAPDWPSTAVRLSAVLLAILRRGTPLRLFTTSKPENSAVIDALGEFSAEDLQLEVRRPEELDDDLCCIMGDSFCLDGPVDFAEPSPRAHRDTLTLRTDSAFLQRRRAALSAAWEEAG